MTKSPTLAAIGTTSQVVMCGARLGLKAAATARLGELRPARTSGRALQDGSGQARARLGLSRSLQVVGKASEMALEMTVPTAVGGPVGGQ